MKKTPLQDRPERYWNFDELSRPPRYRSADFPESREPELRQILYDGVPVDGAPAPVFAYIGYPAATMPSGGYPGVLLVHGGAGTAFGAYAKEWLARGFAVVMPDYYNQHPVAGKLDGDGGPYGLPLPGGRRHLIPVNVANLVLAHSLLRSLPRVNPDRTAYIGLSWGSWYGSAVTALDPRFRGAVEIYCGDINLGKKHLVNGRFLPQSKCPMYWTCITNDRNVTLRTLQRAWRSTPTYVSHSIAVSETHSHIGFTYPSCFRMADHFLNGGVPLPKLGDPAVRGGVASVKILGEGRGIRESRFCYTLDRGEKTPWRRRWLTIPAERHGDTLSAKLPDGLFQGFFSAFDEDSPFGDCCGSSGIIFR